MQARIQKVTTTAQSSFTFRDRTSPRFPFSWHFHPEHELTLILRSRGTRFVGDSVEDYEDGDLVLLGSNLPHTWHSDPDHRRKRRHRALVALFRMDFLGDGFFERPELESVAKLLEDSSTGLRFSGEGATTARERLVSMRKLRGLPQLVALLEALEALARGAKAHPLASPTFTPSLDENRRRRIDRVFQFIGDHYTQAVTQPEAASVAGMSPAAFSRFFKRAVGKTFVEYVNQLRVTHACRLLIETDWPIVDVCFRSGFNNLSNFNRRFLKLRAVSPRAFRARYRAG